MTTDDPAVRLRSIVEYVDGLLDGISKVSTMYAPDMASCEQLAVRLLEIRALALGASVFDWKGWCQANYADVPGPIRHIAGAIEHRLAKAKVDEPVAIKFTLELARMIGTERARQDQLKGSDP